MFFSLGGVREWDSVHLSVATVGQFWPKVKLQCSHLLLLVQRSQRLRPSKDPQKALCVYEGRSGCGKSTVMVLFQLFRGDCECVQTGTCNANMILRESCKTKKT